MTALIQLAIAAAVALLRLFIRPPQPPKPQTPDEELAEHFRALREGDKHAFGRRRRRFVLRRLSRHVRMRDDQPPQ